jgi:hypothetical protein
LAVLKIASFIPGFSEFRILTQSLAEIRQGTLLIFQLQATERASKRWTVPIRLELLRSIEVLNGFGMFRKPGLYFTTPEESFRGFGVQRYGFIESPQRFLELAGGLQLPGALKALVPGATEGLMKSKHRQKENE